MASGTVSVTGEKPAIPLHSLAPAEDCLLFPWDVSTIYHALLYIGSKSFLLLGIGLSDS